MLTLTKEPIFYGFIGALISIIITYIDTKIFKDNKDKITYCKVGFLTFLIVTGILYLINSLSLTINNNINSSVSNLHSNLNTDTPPF
tara:strand:+ start:530 stop:790 length:261 start_codon:yes stop_codon:yes gene_type:complete